jgi:hypothetical protein
MNFDIKPLRKKKTQFFRSPLNSGVSGQKGFLKITTEKMTPRFDYDYVYNLVKEFLGIPEFSPYTLMAKEKYLSDVF